MNRETVGFIKAFEIWLDKPLILLIQIKLVTQSSSYGKNISKQTEAPSNTHHNTYVFYFRDLHFIYAAEVIVGILFAFV